MAHSPDGTIATPLAPTAAPSTLCKTCGRRLKRVYPNLVSLGAGEAWPQPRLACPAGCESWRYDEGTELWVRDQPQAD
jgi:hypothetical protein